MGQFSYESARWKHLRAKALRRDGYLCQRAVRYGKRVPAEVVHHIYPVEEYPEYACCLWNLVSLSRAAHNALHQRSTGALTEEGKAWMTRVSPPLPKEKAGKRPNGVGKFL